MSFRAAIPACIVALVHGGTTALTEGEGQLSWMAAALVALAPCRRRQARVLPGLSRATERATLMSAAARHHAARGGTLPPPAARRRLRRQGERPPFSPSRPNSKSTASLRPIASPPTLPVERGVLSTPFAGTAPSALHPSALHPFAGTASLGSPPTSRAHVASIGQWMERELVKLRTEEARKGTSETHVLKAARAIYSVAFRQVTRQVTVVCAGEDFKGCRSVLSRVPFFRAALGAGFREGEAARLEIKDAGLLLRR